MAYEREAPAKGADCVVDEAQRRRRPDPAAIARLDAVFAAAPPEWQEVFAELNRRDPKMS